MPSLSNITLKRDIRKGEAIIRIEFPYNKLVMDTLKEKTSALWSPSKRCWYMPESDFQLSRFFTDLKPVAYIDYREIKDNKLPENIKPEKLETTKHVMLPGGYLEQLQQVRYSDNTINIYTHYFKDFAAHFSGRALPEITKEEIND